MTLTEALVSGIVQGLTEFLPVSSSGHLVLVHGFFGFTGPGLFFDICLHVGTLMAVILYFGKDIISLVREKNTKWLFCIIIGTIPAVPAALLFEDRIGVFFTSPRKVAFMLVLTAMILFAGQLKLWKRTHPGKGPAFYTSLLVGIGQAFALFPGISRSGITISTGLLGGMKAEDAFRFSFLLSIPVIAGALLYKSLKIDAVPVLSGGPGLYIAGMFTAFITGMLSLFLLWKIIKVKRLFVFGIYCLTLGVSGIILWK